MNRRGLLTAILAVPVVALGKEAKAVNVPIDLKPEIWPAPNGAKIMGPAIFDRDGKRIGQLVFRAEGFVTRIPDMEGGRK